MVKKVFFDITNYCNANCIYCFTNSGKILKNLENELTYIEIERLIDDLVEIGVTELSIGGGEPCVRDFCRVIDYVGDRMKTSVTTNGTIINDKIIKCLSENKTKITVSLDSVDPFIAQKVRKGIEVDKVLSNIEILAQDNIVRNNMSIRCTITKHNIDDVEMIADFCKRIGIKKLKVNSVNKFGRGKSIDVIPEFNEFMERLDSLKGYCDMTYLDLQLVLPVEKYLIGSARKCSLGNDSIYIDPSGNVFPCAFSEGRLYWGNVTRERISDILDKNWNHETDVCKSCPINRYKDYEVKTI